MKLWIAFSLVCITLSFHTNGQTNENAVVVLPVKMAAPSTGKLIGTIKVGNNKTTNKCDYINTIDEAKSKALKMGGNLIKIIRLVDPVFFGSCYAIQADVYSIADISPYAKLRDTITVKEPEKGKFATLYIYRLGDTLLPSINYSVHLNGDSVLCKTRSKSAFTTKLLTEEHIALWAKNETRKELSIDVKYGDTYYIRCGVQQGNSRQQPVLELMNSTEGANEYKKISKEERESNPDYLKKVH